MDFHGEIDLRDNKMQNLVFQQELSFSANAIVGSVVFKDNRLYMAVATGNDTNLIWLPVTESIDTYIHDQTVVSDTWTITHSLGAGSPLVQVYDENNNLIIPDTVIPSNDLELIITFSTAIIGRAVIMHGDEIPANGVGIIEP